MVPWSSGVYGLLGFVGFLGVFWIRTVSSWSLDWSSCVSRGGSNFSSSVLQFVPPNIELSPPPLRFMIDSLSESDWAVNIGLSPPPLSGIIGSSSDVSSDVDVLCMRPRERGGM